MGRVSVRAAFIDRDGTINVKAAEHEYVTSEREFAWLPGAVDGLVLLAKAGYVLAVVSNQRGVARGLVDRAVLAAIEERIQQELAPHGVRIAAFRYCIHGPEDRCECRKPRPGLLLTLAEELDLDLRRSWMIGDSDSDVLAGRAAGCQTALVARRAAGAAADLVAESLADAAAVIAGRGARPGHDAVSPARSGG